MKLILFALTLAFSTQAFAIASSDTDESVYQQGYQQKVAPFFKDVGQGGQGLSGEFAGQAGVKIRYRGFIHPRAVGSITISNGSTETYDKYAEVTYDLYQLGYSVFLIDHRGQGHSQRLLGDPEKEYVDRFENFVYDLKTFVDTVVRPNSHGPLLLLGHSLGGAIGAEFLELYPDVFKAAAFVAPMMKINLGPYTETEALLQLAVREFWNHTGEEYAQGESDPLDEVFDADSLTQSQARWDMTHQIWVGNPSLRLCGETNHWVREAVGASLAIRSPDWAASVRTPTFILQAGQDSLVSADGENEFCGRARGCVMQIFPDSHHEILMEVDRIRDVAMFSILAFFNHHAND